MKTAIFISGRGSNMEALLKAAQKPGFPAEIICVLSNNPDAKGLETAAQAGIPITAINHRDFDSRESFEDAIHAHLSEIGTELICLAGFMRILTGAFVEKWQGRMINIHPSLLPAFPGLHTHERAIEAGVRITGCTVHFVTPEMDAGPIILQAAVPVQGDDTPDMLAARVLAQEHVIYPRALELVAGGMTKISGEQVGITSENMNPNVLISPST